MTGDSIYYINVNTGESTGFSKTDFTSLPGLSSSSLSSSQHQSYFTVKSEGGAPVILNITSDDGVKILYTGEPQHTHAGILYLDHSPLIYTLNKQKEVT